MRLVTLSDAESRPFEPPERSRRRSNVNRALVVLITLALSTSAASFVCAYSIAAEAGWIPALLQTPQVLSERIGRNEERIEGIRAIHSADSQALREMIHQHNAVFQERFNVLEERVFWLFGVSGITGIVAGGVGGVQYRRGQRPE